MRVLVTGGSGFIGTHLMSLIMKNNVEIMNLDIAEPKVRSHGNYYKLCDITDMDSVLAAFNSFQPSHVVHLAARTDTDGSSLEDYVVNSLGTKVILESVKRTQSVQSVVVTSTQFVHRPGDLPRNDQDFDPHTIYGESKVIAERLTRDAGLDGRWTIVRPTNIWGPWHPRYPKEFWRILQRGLYLHPSGPPVIRSYGYVENVANQLFEILLAPSSRVSERVIYVGDAPIDLYEWVNAFSIELTGRPVRVAPRSFLRLLGWAGDLASGLGLRAPITSSRFRSMTQDYLTPMDGTFELLGKPAITLSEGVATTVNWLRRQGQS